MESPSALAMYSSRFVPMECTVDGLGMAKRRIYRNVNKTVILYYHLFQHNIIYEAHYYTQELSHPKHFYPQTHLLLLRKCTANSKCVDS